MHFSVVVALLFSCLLVAFAHENVHIPAGCPRGKYSRTGARPTTRIEDCLPCPRGRYGSIAGLTSFACTAGCPAGKYNDQVGSTSANECKFCPPGTYGTSVGLSTSKCTARCPIGKFSRAFGATSSTSCIDCFDQFNEYQCNQSRRNNKRYPVPSYLDTDLLKRYAGSTSQILEVDPVAST